MSVEINGAAVKLLRERAGWRANAFAKRAGIVPGYLRDIEAGRRKLERSPNTIVAIARALEVPLPMVLLHDEPEPPLAASAAQPLSPAPADEAASGGSASVHGEPQPPAPDTGPLAAPVS